MKTSGSLTGESSTESPSSAEVSRALMCPALVKALASLESAVASGGRWCESSEKPTPSGLSGKMFADCSRPNVAGRWEPCCERWPTAGIVGHGGCWTVPTLALPSDVPESMASSLAEVIEPTAPEKYYLTTRAMEGISRRHLEKEIPLPNPLRLVMALVGLDV